MTARVPPWSSACLLSVVGDRPLVDGGRSRELSGRSLGRSLGLGFRDPAGGRRALRWAECRGAAKRSPAGRWASPRLRGGPPVIYGGSSLMILTGSRPR